MHDMIVTTLKESINIDTVFLFFSLTQLVSFSSFNVELVHA